MIYFDNIKFNVKYIFVNTKHLDIKTKTKRDIIFLKLKLERKKQNKKT